MPVTNQPCEFVSERSGIACQVRGEHSVHQAWDENGNVILKKWAA